MEQKRKQLYKWKTPKHNENGDIVDNNGELVYSQIDPDRISLTPLPRTCRQSYHNPNVQIWDPPQFEVSLLDSNLEKAIDSPGKLTANISSRNKDSLTDAELTYLREILAGLYSFHNFFRLPPANPTNGEFLSLNVNNVPKKRLKYSWGREAISSYSINTKSINNIDKLFDDFFAIASEHPDEVPVFENLQELGSYAITLYFDENKKTFASGLSIYSPTYSDRFIQHRNVLEAARFLPRFINQSEIKTLREYIENNEPQPYSALPSRKSALKFIAANSNQISRKGIYERLLDINVDVFNYLVLSGHRISNSGSSIDASIFDVFWASEKRKVWSSSREIRKALLTNFAELYDLVEQKANSPEERGRLELSVARLQNMRLSVPAFYFIEMLDFNHIAPIYFTKLVKSCDNLDIETFNKLKSFLWKETEKNWVKSDADNTVLRYMFDTLSIEEIRDLAIEVIDSPNLREITVRNWFKYIEGYHTVYKDMPLEWALQMDNLQTT